MRSVLLATVAALTLFAEGWGGLTLAAQEAQPEQSCAPAMVMLRHVHEAVAIEKVTPLSGEKAEKLRDWLNAQPPQEDKPYDLVLVIQHKNGRFGVTLGWRKDPKLDGEASLCVAAPVKDEQLAEFSKITGLGGTEI